MMLRSLYLFLLIGHGFEVSANQGKKENSATQSVSTKIFYYKNTFGHLHIAPYPASSSLTTIACGFPLKIIIDQKDKLYLSKEWFKAEVGGQQGFINRTDISPTKPKCLQDKYSAFFNMLNLDLENLYYWGRLYDQFIEVETNI
jgi:hypothetical protein